jgi:hypothetical protein
VSRDTRASRLRNSHSQTTKHFQRMPRSRLRLCSSRLLFPAILFFQYALRDFGIRPSLHLCPCQKQPWTKINFFFKGKTRSGRLGRSARCSRYRYPKPKTSRRTSNSGLVPLDRTKLICLLRCAGVKLSTDDSPVGVRNWDQHASNRTKRLFWQI